MDLELGQIAPVLHPFVEQPPVRGLHDLVAALEVRRDPARDVGQPFGRHAAALAKALVHAHRVAEMLDHHVARHRSTPSFFRRTRTRSAITGLSDSPHFWPIAMLSLIRPGIALIAFWPSAVE